MKGAIGMNTGLFLSRFPDLTGILIGVGLLGAFVLAAFLLALRRLRGGTARQSEAADYGDDHPDAGASENKDHIPPSPPEK
jgi:hypothetical protein